MTRDIVWDFCLRFSPVQCRLDILKLVHIVKVFFSPSSKARIPVLSPNAVKNRRVTHWAKSRVELGLGVDVSITAPTPYNGIEPSKGTLSGVFTA